MVALLKTTQIQEPSSATVNISLDSSGNVGIGTIGSSSNFLTIGNGGTNTAPGLIINGGASAANGPVIIGQSSGSNEWLICSLRGVDGGTGNKGLVDYVYGANPRVFYTNNSERMRIDSSGNVGIGTASPTQTLTVNGAVGYNAPVSVTGATYSVAATDNWIIANRAGTVTLTLPTASSYTGRILTVKNVQAQTVVSASSNVVPIGSTTAGTAILAATAGKFATLVSDGTNWIIMQAN